MFFTDFARRPISDTSPSGDNPNNLEEFDEIKRQINNLSKVTGSVSWKKVQTLSKKILVSDSKDFRCSCYYTVAAMHNDGLKGFVEGLHSLLDLCVVYWHSAYPDPSKPNARIGAMEWLIEHADKRLKKINISEDHLPLLEAGHRVCLSLEEELRLHYGIKAPSFGGIRRELMQHIENLKDKQAEKERQAKNKAVKVEIMKPATPQPATPPKTATPTKKEHESRSAIITISAMVIALFVIVSSYFIYQNHQLKSLKTNIESGSIHQIEVITDKLSVEYKDFKDDIKPLLISRLNSLMNGWQRSPLKVTQMDSLGNILDNVVALYPDSSSALKLNQEFYQQRRNIEVQYSNLHKQFTNARTVFANVIANSADNEAKKAYQYSNTLFPLLGRIEYSEKSQNLEELNRSLELLNIYLHKINQVQHALETTKQ
ncbi:type VI secretion system ImpA family N-terminal domain-containing protein [Vibrio olivae]|uniref:Type VI secretion system ImpA family N-terminal domain-containing protein n=1 Tax=Vibrio olivae TaxID=1243002 RepID=A0ABV5HIQ2_9VIBR